MAKKSVSKALKDFWYGKPHTAAEGGRRLGDLHEDKTHLYKHREWRGVKDTMYYFYNIWLYNYIFMVKDVMVMGGPINFAKGVWRYRWVGLHHHPPVPAHVRRRYPSARRQAERPVQAHHRPQRDRLGRRVLSLGRRDHQCASRDDPLLRHLPRQLPHRSQLHRRGPVHRPARRPLPHVPGRVRHLRPGRRARLRPRRHHVLDDVPDYAPAVITCNEACDASVSTSTLQDWFFDKPLFSLPMPMLFDDPLVKKYVMREIEELWKFVEDQYGIPFSWEKLTKKLELQNELQRFEWEKWEVAGKTDYYPVNGVAQALYRIYQTQYGDWEIWHVTDKKVRKILEKCVSKKINSFPQTRHRVIAWSCAPLYYSNWCTWAYNCWGLNVIPAPRSTTPTGAPGPTTAGA